MEKLQFLPKGLEQILEHPYAKKILKNREGYAQLQENGQTIRIADGKLLDVFKAASLFQGANPNSLVTVVEDICGTTRN